MSPERVLEKLQRVKPQKIGKVPVVVLPLAEWRDIEAMLEDYEMAHSSRYLRSIKEARKEAKLGKLYELNLQTGRFRKVQKIR